MRHEHHYQQHHNHQYNNFHDHEHHHNLRKLYLALDGNLLGSDNSRMYRLMWLSVAGLSRLICRPARGDYLRNNDNQHNYQHDPLPGDYDSGSCRVRRHLQVVCVLRRGWRLRPGSHIRCLRGRLCLRAAAHCLLQRRPNRRLCLRQLRDHQHHNDHDLRTDNHARAYLRTVRVEVERIALGSAIKYLYGRLLMLDGACRRRCVRSYNNQLV